MNIGHWGAVLAASSAEAMPEGTILQFNKALLYNIGIQWLNVMLLTAVLAFLLYKPVRKYMADRARRIQEQFELASAGKDEAAQLKLKYDGMIKDIEKEREKILKEAHEKALQRSDRIIADARREAESIYHRALEEIREEQANAKDEIKRQIIEISVMMAGRFVEVSMDREAQDKYIEQSISHLEDVLWRD